MDTARGVSARLCLQPYIPFSEPLSATVDTMHKGGAMRLSYYDGADVFIDTKNASSYKIVPVDGQLVSWGPRALWGGGLRTDR